MATLDEQIDALISQGVSLEQINRRVRAKATQVIKDHFLSELIDRSKSPAEQALVLRVNNWSQVKTFFSKSPGNVAHPQAIHRDLLSDLDEAIDDERERRFLEALMLIAKSVKP